MSERRAGNATQSPRVSQQKLAVSQTSKRKWSHCPSFFFWCRWKHRKWCKWRLVDNCVPWRDGSVACEKWVFTFEKLHSWNLKCQGSFEGKDWSEVKIWCIGFLACYIAIGSLSLAFKRCLLFTVGSFLGLFWGFCMKHWWMTIKGFHAFL